MRFCLTGENGMEEVDGMEDDGFKMDPNTEKERNKAGGGQMWERSNLWYSIPGIIKPD